MIDELAGRFALKVVAPFVMDVKGRTISFDCLIENYGAKNGMIIDKESAKLMDIADELNLLGYGFSCFDISEGDAVESFQEVLDDWGKFDSQALG